LGKGTASVRFGVDQHGLREAGGARLRRLEEAGFTFAKI